MFLVRKNRWCIWLRLWAAFPLKYGDVRKGNCLLTQSELNNVEDMSGNIQLSTLKENIFESFKDCRNMITRCHKCPKIEKSQDFPTLPGFQTKSAAPGFRILSNHCWKAA